MNIRPFLQLHFWLAGGARPNALILAVYVVLVGGIAAASYGAASEQDVGQISSTWLGIMSAASALFMLLFGPGAVRRAVLRDFQTGMIESHRLTPQSGLSIALGYLLGAPVQAIALSAVTLLLGAYFCVRVGQEQGFVATLLAGWLIAQGCLAVLAIMVGSIVLLTALATSGKANIVGLLFAIAAVGGWGVVMIVPGLALITGIMSAGVFLDLFFSGTPAARNQEAVLWAAALQAALASVCVAAAAGKVRRPHAPLFGLGLGMLLVALWAVILVAGTIAKHQRRLPWDEPEYLPLELVASTTTFLLVALLPLTAAAAERVRHARIAALAPHELPGTALRHDLVPPLLAAITGIVLQALMLGAVSPPRTAWLAESAIRPSLASGEARFVVIASLLCAFWTFYAVLNVVIARNQKVLRATLLLLVGWLALPVVLDLLVLVGMENPFEAIDSGQWPWAMGASPLGTLAIQIYGLKSGLAGLVVQVLIAAAATIWMLRSRRALASVPARPAAQA